MASAGSVAPQFGFYQTQTMWILCGNGLNNLESSSKQFDHSVNHWPKSITITIIIQIVHFTKENHENQ